MARAFEIGLTRPDSMSLTRAKRNFPANAGRRVPPAPSAVVSESVGKLSSLRSLRALLLNQPSLRDSEPPPSLPGVETPGYFREVPPGLRDTAEAPEFPKGLTLKPRLMRLIRAAMPMTRGAFA